MTQNWAARKSPRAPLRRNGSRSRSRHSLVTPIDWKHGGGKMGGGPVSAGRHSLVTPIDWKRVGQVTIRLSHGSKWSPFFGDAY